MIKRLIDPEALIKPGKVLVIYGPRQVGKTTLLKAFLSGTHFKYRLDSGDNIRISDLLGSRDFARLLEYAEGYELIAIDEAQQIPGIGMGLKILVDQRPDLMVVATGSSSFDLSGMLGEPLTGRKLTVTLYPIALSELSAGHNRHELREMLPSLLIFGCYPEIINAESTKGKITALEELTWSYLLKDVLSLERTKGPRVLLDLLKLLSFQVGSLVSHHELATQLKIDVKTVERYLDLLEKTFVLRKVCGFSRNLRKEITAKSKYYFLDNGIRNSVISNFNSLNDRSDIGALWENFIFCEMLKKRTHEQNSGLFYFWKTYSGQEVDLVEERDGRIMGYECKWSDDDVRVPAKWHEEYPEAMFKVITHRNFLEYLLH
ncbi:MAG: ATP-binding protein [Candidatus Wallbacteria bacterium]|nr:ATP-binding protein [Candidatus Wallbacteria bacterium]